MSAGGIEELVIPVRFDSADAAQDLRKVEAAGKAAGDATAQGFDSASGAAKGLGSEIAGILKAQIGLAAVRHVAGQMGDEFRRAAEYTERLAKQFEHVRQALQQVAALRGENNTNQFALGQVREAAAAGLMPEEWVRAQEEFQSRAGGFLEGPQARLNQQQGAAYQQRIAAFAKARGIAPSEAMALGGGLLQFSEGKQDVEGLMARYGRVFRTLERAPTPIGQLLPQMSRIMSQGFSPEEAAQALAIASEAMPGEEETGVEGAIRAITQARLKGKGGELGLKQGMTPMQQLEAAARTLKARVARGEDLDVLMKEYAPDLRERRGLLAFMNRGVASQGFERYRQYQTETEAGFTAQAVEEYEQSDEGRADRRRVMQALAEAERGARAEPIEAELERARTEVTRRGDLEEARAANLYRRAVGGLSGVTPEQQIINEEAVRRLRTRALELGIHQDAYGEIGRNPFGGGVWTRDVLGRDQQSVNMEIRDLLKRIADATRQQAEQTAKPAPALTVRIPANHGGARQ